MNKDFVKFIFIVSGVTAFFVLAGWIFFKFFLPLYYLKVLPFLLLVFALISIGVHGYQIYLIKKDIGSFTRTNMILTFLKLFIYSVFAISYLATNSKNAIPFVICLGLLYATFSFIEVTEITRIIRRKKR